MLPFGVCLFFLAKHFSGIYSYTIVRHVESDQIPSVGQDVHARMYRWYFERPVWSGDRIRRRMKRDEEIIKRPNAPAYELPYLYYPFEGQGPEDLEPLFPMTHNYNTGLQFGKPDGAVMGHVKAPIPNWGVWDLHGSIFPQTANPTVNYGHLLSPVNTLNFSPQEIDTMLTSEKAQEIKALSPKSAVNNIPNVGSWRGYGVPSYKPLRCKPPMCNPYTHMFANGYSIQQGIDVQIPARLDFPIPGKTPTSPSYRNVLSMDPIFGVQPLAFNYGHAMSGINPWVAGFRPAGRGRIGNPMALNRVMNPQEDADTDSYNAPRIGELNIFSEDTDA